MFIRSDNNSGRGGHLPGLSALGLVLVAVGLVVSQTSGFHVLPPGQGGQPVTQASSAISEATLVPFVVEPSVRFERATPPGPSRTAGKEKDRRKRGERPATAAGVPVRLVVPRLGVNAPVIGISATNGVLLPPGDPQTLGWWSGGARPGAVYGGALITGHTVHTGGGAFDDLDTLDAGDTVRVATPDGVLRYVVSGVATYRKATLAADAERIFSQSVPGRLVLVTCEDWNGEIYLSNAVVFAAPVDPAESSFVPDAGTRG